MDFLQHTASRMPLAIAIQDGDRSVRFGELDRQVERLVSDLDRLGIQSGHRVGLQAEVSTAAVIALHAIRRLNAVVCPGHPRWNPEESEVWSHEVGLNWLISPVQNTRIGAQVSATPETLPASVCDGSLLLHQLAADTSEAHYQIPAVVLYTSGSSGSPKLVELTDGNLEASCSAVAKRLQLKTHDGWYGSLALSHVGGMALVTRCTLLGSRLIIPRSRGTNGMAEAIADGSVTHASLVPTMLFDLLERWGDRPVPSTLRCLLIGGAAAPLQLVERALTVGFPVAVTYGLSEATSQVATSPPELTEQKPGTVGAPLDGIEVRISDGELRVHGPTVVSTQAAPDGWLSTGDLGHVDDEGHIWITGRLSDRIISGGVNVDPGEIEAHLCSSDEITAAVVLGLPHPRWGEEVVAAVLPALDRKPRPQDIGDHLRTILSGAKIPKRIFLFDAFPHNPNGKIDRVEVKNLVIETAARSPEDSSSI